MIPVPLGVAIHQLVAQDVSGGVGDLETADIAHPVPDRQLGDHAPFQGHGIEDVEDPGLAAAPLGIGDAVAEAHMEAHAAGAHDAGVDAHIAGGTGALGLAHGHIGVHLDGGGIDGGGDGLGAAAELGLGVGEGFGELAQGVFTGVLDAGAGDDVVEMGVEDVLPGGLVAALVLIFAGEGHPALGIVQQGLGPAVGGLDAGLGGVAAGEDVVELPVDDGQAVPDRFRFPEEFPEGAEFDGGPDGPGLHFDGVFDIPPGGAAAVVAHAVDDQTGLEAAAGFGDIENAQADLGDDAGIIPVLLPVDQQLPARGGTPAVEGGLPVQGPAVVHIFHAAEPVDLGDEGAVAEGVGGKVDLQALWVHAPGAGEVIFGIADMAQQGFGGGHIFIRLHPLGSGDLPAAFGDALFDLGHQLGVVFLHHLVDGGLGLGEAELGVLLHQVQHRPEGGQGGGHGLGVGPHPVHIQVGVACQDELVFLRRRLQGQQLFLGLPADGPGQGALPGHGVGQVGKGFVNGAIEGAAVGFAEPDGEFHLTEHPLQVGGGDGDVLLLLHRLAEALLIAVVLPVAADGGLQLDKSGPKIHVDLSFFGSEGFDGVHIQPAWGRDGAGSPVGAEHILPADQLDADGGDDQAADGFSRPGRDQAPLHIADGDGQVRPDNDSALAGVAVHAAVDVHADDEGPGAVDGLDGGTVIIPDLPLEAGAQEAVHHGVKARQTAGPEGMDRNICGSRQGGVVGAVGAEPVGDGEDGAVKTCLLQDTGQGVAVAAVVTGAGEDGGATLPVMGTEHAPCSPVHQLQAGDQIGDGVCVAVAHIGDGNAVKHGKVPPLRFWRRSGGPPR